MSAGLASAVVEAARAVPGVAHLYPATSIASRVVGLITDADRTRDATLVRIDRDDTGRATIALSLAVSPTRSAAVTAREVERAVALVASAHGEPAPRVAVTISHITAA